MDCKLELQQTVYDILLTQIQSGTYRFGENLPTIEEMSKYFHVSIDTARAAYRRLMQEGYISLSKNVGAKVIVQRNEQEIARHIQTFFAARKDALFDLSSSLRPLFGHAQWIGLRHASPETLDRMEKLSNVVGEPRAPYAMWQCLEQKYTALGNDLLIRLAWQVYMFLHAPFFSIDGSISYLENGVSYERDLLALCRHKDWTPLQDMVNGFQDQLSAALRRFFDDKITVPSPEQRIAFQWNSYKKPSQLCYSLAMELLIDINRGVYPEGGSLPTAEQLSAEKGISISTVRRAVSLLVSIGAVKSCRPHRARILPFDQSFDHCDFTQPVLQRRLLDMVMSLQVLALSCRAVSECTLASLDGASIRQWLRELDVVKQRRHYEVLDYSILSLIAKSAPCQAIRTIYSELLRQLFWGNPFRSMKGDPETINAVYRPYFDVLMDCLKRSEFSRFSSVLEEIITHELQEIAGYLVRLKIPGAENVLIPDGDEWCASRMVEKGV